MCAVLGCEGISLRGLCLRDQDALHVGEVGSVCGAKGTLCVGRRELCAEGEVGSVWRVKSALCGGGNGLCRGMTLEPILRVLKYTSNERLNAPIKNALVTLHR